MNRTTAPPITPTDKGPAVDLRPRQRAAADAVLHAIEAPATSETLAAARRADELAGQVWVLMPPLDLLTETESIWTSP
ncbi:hypothetical protein [Streptomyces hirsutus]|uniref:hypothetical protein n=1 Tax=Streptomyces hirsutus TaxID=35620 RepID=UPI00367C197C